MAVAGVMMVGWWVRGGDCGGFEGTAVQRGQK